MYTILEAKRLVIDQSKAEISPRHINEMLLKEGVLSSDGKDLLSHGTVATLVSGTISGRLNPHDNTTTPPRAYKRKVARKKDSELQDFAKRIGYILEFGSLTDEQKIAEIRNVLRRI